MKKTGINFIKEQGKNEVREEMKKRLRARGYQIQEKGNKKFWAIKSITKEEIKQIIDEITVLLEVVDMDGGNIRPILTFSYALLNETKNGAAGISIEI